MVAPRGLPDGMEVSASDFRFVSKCVDRLTEKRASQNKELTSDRFALEYFGQLCCSWFNIMMPYDSEETLALML